MSRQERRQAKRMTQAIDAFRALQIVSGAIGVLSEVATDLDAGRLDPGTQERADFIFQVREIQGLLDSNPAFVIAKLSQAFSKGEVV
ncbi:MAG: hypothetical protein WCP98_01120 [Actinomycetes bacterium]